ncbi:Hemerythrin family protein [Paramagnetospirillum magnetotacticum MS-1]|uniref:Hemerythrin family protein n=1 Tax=Paramagnetospirillum magnetotacticum MS-1 TaxID=272627 RepID=A0A0C2UZ95_PARME|nr:bacteriohemerythrin [Paramagnetospirillum magnetotacticum]KIL98131.1 Hemerythrin family protein [Paramagnetospirillum magnetotacticum MS-1]
MAYLQWTENLSVGIARMDEHHKKLVDLINQVFDAMSGDASAAVDSVLADLLDYTRYHFAEEEKLLAACAFPDLEEHQAVHRSMVKEVMEMRSRHLADPASVTASETLDFLSKWLMRHIIGKDLRYRPFAENHSAI